MTYGKLAPVKPSKSYCRPDVETVKKMPPGVASTCMKLLCIFIFQGYSIYIYTYIDAISLHVDMRHPKYVCICLFDKSFHSVQNHFHTHFTKWKRNAVLAAFLLPRRLEVTDKIGLPLSYANSIYQRAELGADLDPLTKGWTVKQMAAIFPSSVHINFYGLI